MADEQDIKKQEFKKRVFTGKDGIIHVDMAEVSTEEDIENIISAIKETLDRFEGKGKILIKMTPFLANPIMRTSAFRKRMVEKAKDIFRESGFDKAAIFGASIITGTIASFIIAAIGLKNVRLFKTKEEALGWLKQP